MTTATIRQQPAPVSRPLRTLWISLLAAALATILPAVVPAGADCTSLTLTTEGVYAPGQGDSAPLTRLLALYRAKVAAAEQAADRFADRRIIQFATHDRNELVNLVADNLKPEVLVDRWETTDKKKSYKVRLRVEVKLSDFIDAQLENLKLSSRESRDNYMQEMEPYLPEPLMPGHALAKAHRLIRARELRMAVIYLDRVIARYPNWQEAAELKTLALQRQGEVL